MTVSQAWIAGYEAGLKVVGAEGSLVEVPFPPELPDADRGEFVVGFGRGMSAARDNALVDEIIATWNKP